MLMQDLYRVSNNNTWVTVVTDGTLCSSKYNGVIMDIPVSLLDSHIKSLSAIDMNHLLITIA